MTMAKKILVTGGAGFVGSHFIEHLLKQTDWDIVTLDRFDAAGNPNRLSEMLETTEGIDRSRVKFVFWDLKAAFNEGVKKQLGGQFDYIAHLAAGSHVDRSIDDPMLFFQDNCIGTVNLLDYARHGGLVDESHIDPSAKGKFLYFSTDEVYGPAPIDDSHAVSKKDIEIAHTGFKEWDRLNPNNPYAAAKAAAEMAVIAYANTYRIPCVITNAMNIFGERQDPEKFIPLVINKTLHNEPIQIHANKEKTQAGKRHYLHARNVAAAALWVIENGNCLDGSGKQGRYNIVGEQEVDNLALARLIYSIVKEVTPSAKEPKMELVDFHSSRPGHDLRYALDGSLLESEGFKFSVDFENSLRKMVYWTLEHKNQWL
jgi:dTDP-glucose 4,6-dehydratase